MSIFHKFKTGIIACAIGALLTGQYAFGQERVVPGALTDSVDDKPKVQVRDANSKTRQSTGEIGNDSAKNDAQKQNPTTNGDPNQPQSKNTQNGNIEIKINQPYSSEALGQLVLPFMWEVSEDDELKRIVAKEVRTHAPAILTVDLIENIPAAVSGEAYAQNIIATIAAALEIDDTSKYEVAREDKSLPCEKKKKCPKIAIYRAQLSGTEAGVARNCAVQIVPNGNRILVLTLCAVQSQSYEPALPQILNAVFEGMK